LGIGGLKLLIAASDISGAINDASGDGPGGTARGGPVSTGGERIWDDDTALTSAWRTWSTVWPVCSACTRRNFLSWSVSLGMSYPSCIKNHGPYCDLFKQHVCIVPLRMNR
jgi:hypothetical protein